MKGILDVKDEKLDFGDEHRFKQNILNYIANYVLSLKMQEGFFDIYLTVYMDFGFTFRMYKLYYPGSCLDNTSGEEFNKIKFRTALRKALYYARDYVLNRRHPLVSVNGFVEITLTTGTIRCEAFSIDITEEQRKFTRPIFSPNLITIEPISERNNSDEIVLNRGQNGNKVVRPNRSVLLETIEGGSSPEASIDVTSITPPDQSTVTATVLNSSSTERVPNQVTMSKNSTVVISLPSDTIRKQSIVTPVTPVRPPIKLPEKRTIAITSKLSKTPKSSQRAISRVMSEPIILNARITKDGQTTYSRITGTSITGKKLPRSSLKTSVRDFRIVEQNKTKNSTTELYRRAKVVELVRETSPTASTSNTNSDEESNNIIVDESDSEKIVTRIPLNEKTKRAQNSSSMPKIAYSCNTPFIQVDIGKLRKLGSTKPAVILGTVKCNQISDKLKSTNTFFEVEESRGETNKSPSTSSEIKQPNAKFTTFPCPFPLCSKSFSLRRSQADHVKKEHGKSPIYCSFCSSIFCWQTDYGHHFLKEHKNEVALMEKGCCCGRYFNGKILLRDHLWKTHYAKGYHCSICSTKFQQTELEPLRHHLMRHSGLMCALCGQEESNPKEYIKHFKNGHPGKTILYSCALCSALLEEAALELHYMTKHCVKSIEVPKASENSGNDMNMLPEKLKKWYDLKDCSIDVRPVDKPKVIQAKISSNKEITLGTGSNSKNIHCSCQCTEECGKLPTITFYQHIIDTKLREKTCQLCKKGDDRKALVPLEPKKFSCRVCGDKIDNVGRHFFEKHFKNGVKCPICKTALLKTFSAFVCHLRSEHQTSKVKDFCPYCCCSISNNEHYKLFHSDRKNIGFYKCTVCNDYIESFYIGYHYLQYHCTDYENQKPSESQNSQQMGPNIDEESDSATNNTDDSDTNKNSSEGSVKVSLNSQVQISNEDLSAIPASSSLQILPVSRRLRQKSTVKRKYCTKVVGPKSVKQRRILLGDHKY